MAEPVVVGIEGRPVAIAGAGLLCPAGLGAEAATGGRPGEVPGFRARAYIPDRKSIKLMTRAVKLGVSGVRLALTDEQGGPAWQRTPPTRRGLYVGASPQQGDPGDLKPALEAALSADGQFDLGRFAADGVPLIHPLWLVRGLSNNVLGFASLFFDLQGVNMNYCDGPRGGWNALVDGARAVAEGRADLVVAGGADSLVDIEPLLGGRRCGEGAAFVVFHPAAQPGPEVALEREALADDEALLGYLGAATWPVAFVRALYRRELL